jgi:ABC-type Zn2+ transport system substrate-binding protein/surface adhesin
LEKSFLIDVVSKIYVATDSSPVDMQTYELCSDMIDVVIDVSCIYGMKEDSDGLAYDDKSQSLIKLSNGMVLYLREVNKCVPLPFPHKVHSSHHESDTTHTHTHNTHTQHTHTHTQHTHTHSTR